MRVGAPGVGGWVVSGSRGPIVASSLHHLAVPYLPGVAYVRIVPYRTAWQAILVVTTRPHVAKQCNLMYGCVPLLLRGGKMSKDEDAVLQQVRFRGSRSGQGRREQGDGVWVRSREW